MITSDAFIDELNTAIDAFMAETNAAMRIQKISRGYKIRVLRPKHEAATKMQMSFRGFKARREANARRKVIEDERNAAATK